MRAMRVGFLLLAWAGLLITSGMPSSRAGEPTFTAEELFALAYQFHQAGDLDRAIRLYRRSILVRPTAQAHTFLGWALSHQGRLDEAIEECRRAIALDPNFGNPWNDIGVYYIEQGRPEDAIPYLEQALESPDYCCYFFPHTNLGRIYLARGDYLRARAAFERALEIEPQYEVARLYLAMLRQFLRDM